MKKSLSVIILLFIVNFLFSQTGGKTVYNFLNLINSGRTAGMGGKIISIYDDDINMSANNPALLNLEMTNKLSVNYIGYFAGIKSGYSAYAFELKKFGVFSAGIQYLNYGKFIGADEVGYKTGEFNASEYAFNLIWSKKLTEKIKAGVNMKPVISQFERYKSFGIAFDLGAVYHTENDFAAGLVGKNIGTQIKPYYEGHYEPLPFDLQLGISKKLAHAPFRLNITAHHLYKWDLTYDLPQNNTSSIFDDNGNSGGGKKLENALDNSLRHLIVGVEFIPLKSFYLNLGYNHQLRKELSIIDKSGVVGFSFGFGLKLKKFTLNYARTKYHLAGSSNQFSLTFNLKEFKKLLRNKEIE